jgi:hypothetical protein
MNYIQYDNGMHIWPTLYKKDKRGKEREWNLAVIPIHSFPAHLPGVQVNASLRIQQGMVGGSIKTSVIWYNHGQHIGRSNSITPLEQATQEGEVKWKKKKEQGYSEERGADSNV